MNIRYPIYEGVYRILTFFLLLFASDFKIESKIERNIPTRKE